jgi:Putative bacterial sensory transduction regulator
VSVDPTPNPPHSASHPDLVTPGLGLVRQVLEELGLSYRVDSRGHVATRWQAYSLFLQFHGDDAEHYSVRTIYDENYSVDDKPAIRTVLDEWNRDSLWPKSYTATGDDGTVIIVSEATMRVDGGVSRAQFVATTTAWLHAAAALHQWLAQRLPLAGLTGSAEDTD